MPYFDQYDNGGIHIKYTLKTGTEEYATLLLNIL